MKEIAGYWGKDYFANEKGQIFSRKGKNLRELAQAVNQRALEIFGDVACLNDL